MILLSGEILNCYYLLQERTNSVAALFALRESVHRSRSKFIRSYVAAMLERDLLTFPTS
jgi:hypothetical protein